MKIQGNKKEVEVKVCQQQLAILVINKFETMMLKLTIQKKLLL